MTEVTITRMVSVAPFQGQQKQVSDAMKSALGLRFPGANRVTASESARAIWAGAGIALVMDGKMPDLAGQAAVTDQSDAWTIVAINGAGTEDVLARLVPIDLRRSTFKTGHTARTLIGHMTGSVSRTGAQGFEIMVMRSMAKTLVHDLTRAATLLAGR